MRNNKTLNIGNTFRSSNWNVSIKKNLNGNVLDMNSTNKTEVTDEMLDSVYWYNIKHKRNKNDSLLFDVLERSLPVSYYTDSTVPFGVLLKLHNNKQGEAIYNSRYSFNTKDVENVNQASSICRTVIHAPIIFGEKKSSPYEIMMGVWNVRYLIDRIDFDFKLITQSQYNHLTNKFKKHYYKLGDKYALDAETKFKYYKVSHEYFARLRMQLNIICDSLDEAAELETMFGELE